MADPCADEQERLDAMETQIRELEDLLPELPPNERPRVRATLERMGREANRLNAALSRCIQEHSPPRPPDPPPTATLRTGHDFGSAVTAVSAAALPGRRAVCGDPQRGVFAIFDSETGELIRNRSFDGAVLGPPVPDPTGTFFFAIGGLDKLLRVVDHDGEITWRAEHTGGITSVAVSPKTGELIVTGAGFGDKNVRAFAAVLGGDSSENHRPLWESLQPSSVTLVAVSGNDAFVAAACKDRSVRLFAADDGATASIFAHDARVEHIAFDPVGRLLVVADADGTVELIDAAAGAKIGSIAHPAPLTSLAFNGDGTLLATATADPDNIVRVWKPEAGESEKVFTSPESDAAITAIAFSPTESRLAIATSAGDPGIVDPVTRNLDRTVPSGVASAMAYSPDGRLLAVAAGQKAKVFNTH